jgi:epoxyqueuosine reductase
VLEPASPKARVAAAALAAGAAAVRVTAAAADERAQARMREAFARGDFSTWPYDAAYAAQASAPQSLLARARSVVCIALEFATAPPRRRAPLCGRVSNYAWSSDYHPQVRTILEAVAREIASIDPAARSALACDTRPLAERAFAERAGLGWIGKHTNLIVPGIGSYVFLGEVVTTLGLPPDAPLRKTCGSCRRCIDVCPTRALRGDGTIEAVRCISDLTQRKDAIPPALRPLLGDWVWGCDLCQEICPPTRRATPRAAFAFAASSTEAAFPPLERLLSLRGGEFKRRYGGSALAWRGPVVLRRNAAVALGNSLDRSAVPALERALRDDPSALVRCHAAWALGRIGSPRAFEALARAPARESNASVRAEIVAALEPVRPRSR